MSSPAGLCSQDHIYGVHANSHDINNCLSSLCICQAVDAQRLQGGGAASKRKQKHLHFFWSTNQSEETVVRIKPKPTLTCPDPLPLGSD